MKKLGPFWSAGVLACVVETLFRLIGHHAGGISPDGSGSAIGIIFFLFHFPAIIITSLLLRDPESPLWLWIEIGTSIITFAMYFWGGIKLWRWYEKKRNVT